MEITEKVAYLKGLAEGLGIDKSTKEGKLFSATIDLLGDIVEVVSEMGQEVEALDEELGEVIEEIYGESDDECCCGQEHFDGELYEVTCPACGDCVCVDEDMLDQGEIACPGCQKVLEFDLGGELDEEELSDSCED